MEKESAEYRFKVSGKSLIGYLYLSRLKWTILPIAAILIALLLWAIIAGDIRPAILMLMVVFILIPMIMGFAYISFALHPDIAFNSLPHSVSVSQETECLRITIYPKPFREETEKNDECVEEPAPVVKTISLRSIILPPYRGFNDYIFRFDKHGLLFIPETLLQNNSELSQTLFQTISK